MPQRISRIVKPFFRISMSIATVVMMEILCRLAFNYLPPSYEISRQVLSGQLPHAEQHTFQNSIGQAYLNYIPAPNYRSKGFTQHNGLGFRGKAVSFRKPIGTYRIVAIGGSTTYGWGVADPSQTYPAFLERELAKRFAGSSQFRSIEVINVGLPWGTSAEHLTHYQFKYHYFQPDLVVLNVGGNDAAGIALHNYYHPDYSNWRQPLSLPPRMSPVGRWLMNSRLFAVGFIPLLSGIVPSSATFIRYDPPDALWYEMPKTAQNNINALPREELSFYHNTDSLLSLIIKDGIQALLVPFRPNPNPASTYTKKILAEMEKEERLLQEFAHKYGLPIAPFPASVISPQNWLDNCHQNAEGSRQKADHIADYVEREMLRVQRPVAARS